VFLAIITGVDIGDVRALSESSVYTNRAGSWAYSKHVEKKSEAIGPISRGLAAFAFHC